MQGQDNDLTLYHIQKYMSKCEQCIIRQFNSLRAMNHDELAAISDSKITKKIKKGDALFEEGESLHGVYCVRSGVSKLSKLSENGKSQIVKLVGRGELLGQRSLIAKEMANLTAEAMDDMEVCFISKEHIVNALQDNSEFAVEVLRHMANDLKQADDVIINMSQKSVKQRMAACLLYLDATYGTDAEGYLRLVLSREDIADIVGTATESAIRMISEFKKLGLIQTSGKRIAIKNKNEIVRLSQS